jgi:hypothetical protein
MQLMIIVAATNVHQTARWLANVGIEFTLLVISLVPLVE